ncbi:phage tail assembly chaperone [Xanthobacter sp. ZOL 2024]
MDTPEEFDLNGITYRARKLGAMDQLFLVQKLTPLATSLVPVIQAAAREASGGPLAGALLKMDVADLMPLAQGISSLPEQDTKAIIGRCLSHVERGTKTPAGTGWAQVWSKNADACMFEDIDLFTMLTIVAHVVKKDLAPFIGALFSGSTGAGLLQTANS